MVSKKRTTITSHLVRTQTPQITPLSRMASKARRLAPGGLSSVNVVSAKTTDILSVLEHSRNFGDLSVGHLVEAVPVSVDNGSGIGWYLGEVVAMKEIDGELFCYIHFLGNDSKVDDWISEKSIRKLSTLEVELKKKQSANFFGLSSFSATSSSIHPRHHIKSIRGVQLGNGVVLKAWYPSPYPEMISCPNSYIKICDTCLSYFRTTDELARHWNYCGFSHPPGIEIYRSDQLSVFEIDGESHNGYCERLLLLAKLFLEEKRAFAQDNSQYAQVRTFHFYVTCRWNLTTGRADLVGYFSKLKNNTKESHILSCILVLPHEQRKGYGNFLIDLSYELALREGRIGSAERPLSSLGQLSFYPYWLRKIVPILATQDASDKVSISTISQLAGIIPEDVAETLKHYGLLKEWGTAGAVIVTNNLPTLSMRGSIFQPELLHWTPLYKFS